MKFPAGAAGDLSEPILYGGDGRCRGSAISSIKNDHHRCAPMASRRNVDEQEIAADHIKLKRAAVRNRERVLEAAKAVFSAGGAEASLEAVARAAGVGIRRCR